MSKVREAIINNTARRQVGSAQAQARAAVVR